MRYPFTIPDIKDFFSIYKIDLSEKGQQSVNILFTIIKMKEIRNHNHIKNQ